MDNPQKPIRNIPLPGTEEAALRGKLDTLIEEQSRYNMINHATSAAHVATFITFVVGVLVVGAIAFSLGHDVASVLTIQNANQQIEQTVQQLNGGVSFLQKMEIAKAYAAETWIPGLGDAVRSAAANDLVDLSCTRDKDPFASLIGQGDAISFSDLSDAAGNVFTCTTNQ